MQNSCLISTVGRPDDLRVVSERDDGDGFASVGSGGASGTCGVDHSRVGGPVGDPAVVLELGRVHVPAAAVSAAGGSAGTAGATGCRGGEDVGAPR